MGSKKATDSIGQMVNVTGHSFTVRTEDQVKLMQASLWINKRYEALAKKHPLMKPAELQALLLLEIAFERLDWVAGGKELLKQTNHLIEWMSNKL
jgi:hypothetical protein